MSHPPTHAPALADAERLQAQLQAALHPAYLVVRLLGAGGMGSVWLARDPILRRLVAVKVLAPELAADPEFRLRFEREAQAVAGLSHPNVLAIHAVGELADGTPWFVMQYVAGRSLAHRLEESGPFDLPEARRLVGEVASALAAAHSKGIVHRDIKPGNILYDEESRRGLVADFGIAALRQTEGPGPAAARITQTGLAVGTPQYMSPEQMLAEAPTDKTDVYALGLLAFELVTGRPVFSGVTPHELIAAHLRDTPPRMATVRPDADPELDALVAACLAKDPAQRPTAAAIAQRLLPGAQVALEWPPPGLDALHGRLARLARWTWPATLALADAALALAWQNPAATMVRATATSLLIATAALVGSLGAFAAIVALVRLLTLGARAVRRGYTWRTVLEAMADARGDTGNLIAGLREYAALAPAARGLLRRGRVTRTLASLTGALLPVPMLLIAASLGAHSLAGPAALPWLVLGPSALLAALAFTTLLAERRATRGARAALARRGRGRDLTRRLVDPWYSTFDATSAGQQLDRGPAGGARAVWWAGAAAAAALALSGAVLLPLWVQASLSSSVVELARPRFLSALERLRSAEAYRPWMLPPDSAITPAAAGEAFAALDWMMRDGTAAHDALRRPSRTLPAFPVAATADSLFVESAPRRARGTVPTGAAVTAAVRRGLRPAERRWLEVVDRHPAWDAVHTVARSPWVDLAGGRFTLPLPADLRPLSIPLPQMAGLRDVARSGVARAAWHAAEGRNEAAATQLRELLSFGFRYADAATSLIELLFAEQIIRAARDGLEALWATSADPAAPALRRAADARLAAAGATDSTSLAFAATPRAATLALLADTTAPRGLRLELLLLAVPTLSCSNVREMIFGPADDVRRAIASAEQQLPRSAADSAMIGLLVRAAFRAGAGDISPALTGAPVSLPGRMLMAAVPISARILDNPRIEFCGNIAAMAMR